MGLDLEYRIFIYQFGFVEIQKQNGIFCLELYPWWVYNAIRNDTPLGYKRGRRYERRKGKMLLYGENKEAY